MSCDLRQLLAAFNIVTESLEVKHLSADSRTVATGDLFAAAPGVVGDGRDYVAKAIENGAAAILIHTENRELHGKKLTDCAITQMYFYDLASHLPLLASRFYQQPGLSINCVGVTGTNGKTTVTQLVAQLNELMGCSATVIGTMGNGEVDTLSTTANTTPGPVEVQRLLRSFADSGIEICAMEVSSHGLEQNRVSQVPFKVGVFTNLSRDHLDYHQTMEAYAAAKARLFDMKSLEWGIFNTDDELGLEWALKHQGAGLPVIGFGINSAEDIALQLTAKDIAYSHLGTQFTLSFQGQDYAIQTQLFGEFNVSNTMAAVAVMVTQGFAIETLVEFISQLRPVPGRMEMFGREGRCITLVDYAHTPDALEQALLAARNHCEGELWCVFGCGGDRDKGKRPQMGAIAEANADKVIITNDNSRSEDPSAIAQDILAGCKTPKSVGIELDRATAVAQAIANARVGDVVLLAGKGHEDQQVIADHTCDYNERALVARLYGEMAQ